MYFSICSHNSGLSIKVFSPNSFIKFFDSKTYSSILLWALITCSGTFPVGLFIKSDNLFLCL